MAAVRGNPTIYTRAAPRDVRGALRAVPGAVSGGRIPTGWGALQRQLLVRVGLTVLQFIHGAFVQKARGGTDEAGERWQPLAPSTILRRLAQPRRRPRARFHPSAGLTPRQRDRWWVLYKQALAWYKGDKAHAAASAWVRLRAEGRVRTLADRVSRAGAVEILRDTGLLLNSLAPGVPADVGTSSPPRTRLQVFRLGRGEVLVGTSRKGAIFHHEGTARLPQRRLWPDPSRWPARWWDAVLDQARQGVIDLVAAELES